jgi:hypothetical protein
MQDELELEWRNICQALGPFLLSETSKTVFVMQRLHPTTMQRLRDTYKLEVTKWVGCHTIRKFHLKPCD